MGKKFSLLQQLDEAQKTPTKVSPFPDGVEYQEYLLEIEGKDETIFIPSKESGAFEAALSCLTKYPTRDDLRNILRTYRGIKGE